MILRLEDRNTYICTRCGDIVDVFVAIKSHYAGLGDYHRYSCTGPRSKLLILLKTGLDIDPKIDYI